MTIVNRGVVVAQRHRADREPDDLADGDEREIEPHIFEDLFLGSERRRLRRRGRPDPAGSPDKDPETIEE